MLPKSRIFVAGHRGLVGRALVRKLRDAGFSNLLVRSRQELDLRHREQVLDWFMAERPEFVFLAAAKVGGIMANSEAPVDFLHENLLIQEALLSAAKQASVEKLLFLGSSCIYPKHAQQPLKEEALLAGPLEPTNKAYAIAKIAGLVACEAFNHQFGTRFIGAMPTNLYGPGDNFDERTSHVLPAMIRKLHDAKRRGLGEVTFWGSGTPRREFLYVDDLAEACVFLMQRFEPTPTRPHYLNVGVGQDLTIAELAERVARVVGYGGQLRWDREMPDGSPRKLLDTSRINALGWRARTSLETGLSETYRWFLAHHDAET